MVMHISYKLVNPLVLGLYVKHPQWSISTASGPSPLGGTNWPPWGLYVMSQNPWVNLCLMKLVQIRPCLSWADLGMYVCVLVCLGMIALHVAGVLNVLCSANRQAQFVFVSYAVVPIFRTTVHCCCGASFFMRVRRIETRTICDFAAHQFHTLLVCLTPAMGPDTFVIMRRP